MWEEQIKAKLAQAYCSDENSYKVVDTTLLLKQANLLIPLVSQLLKQQRESCSEAYIEFGKQTGFYSENISNVILNAPEPFLKQQREKYSVLAKAITDSQDILAQWIVPDSEISDAECLNKLLGVLDSQHLVKFMRLNAPEPSEEQ